jgi:hypothetical protein
VRANIGIMLIRAQPSHSKRILSSCSIVVHRFEA